ncbi:Dopamine receptor 2 [Halotydeus destructor]|nr:Dopamine receptor 2 [Halotydeus destructor]
MASKADFTLDTPWLAIVFFLLDGTIVIGNTLIIIAVYREAYLQRSVTNYYIVSLAIADLLVGVLILPFAALYELADRTWFFGDLFCDIWYAIAILGCTSSIFNLCIVSMDRYWAIFEPLKYAAQVSKRRSMVLIMVAWSMALILSFPMMIVARNADSYPKKPPMTCQLFTNEALYIFVASVFGFYVPLGVMGFVYVSIYRAAKRRLKSYKEGTIKVKCSLIGYGPLTMRVHSRQETATSANCPEPQEPSTPETETESIRRKLNRMLASSNRQISKFNREHRAAKTIGVVFGAFVICWLPYFTYLLALLYFNVDIREPPALLRSSNWLGWSNSAINPFIYIIWSRDFRRAFRRLFQWRRRRQAPSLNSSSTNSDILKNRSELNVRKNLIA